MTRFFDSELETFRSSLILMGETSIRQVRDALTALVGSDIALADRVIAAGLRKVCKYSTMVAAAANLARLSRRLVTLATDAPIVKISPAGCAL